MHFLFECFRNVKEINITLIYDALFTCSIRFIKSIRSHKIHSRALPYFTVTSLLTVDLLGKSVNKQGKKN